jgi:hypothetical protein
MFEVLVKFVGSSLSPCKSEAWALLTIALDRY